mgnify:CR=1 FL=1
MIKKRQAKIRKDKRDTSMTLVKGRRKVYKSKLLNNQLKKDCVKKE